MGEKRTKKLVKKIKFKKAKWAPPPNDGKVRLNLGCGDKILPGYINVDFAESRKGNTPDVIADLRKMEFPEGYADEIMAIHVIEHFYVWEAEEMLQHWRSILKPNGVIVLECPNILTAAKNLVANPIDASRADGKAGQNAMWPLFGDPGWRDPLMCHKWGYTPHTLIELMKKCGYKSVRQEKAMFKQREPRDMRIVGAR